MINKIKAALLGLSLLGFAGQASAITFFAPQTLVIEHDAKAIFTGKPASAQPTIVCSVSGQPTLQNLMIIRKGQPPQNIDVVVFEYEDVQFGDKLENVQMISFLDCSVDGQHWVDFTADIM